MLRRNRPDRSLQQLLGLAVAKAAAVTGVFLAGHVGLAVATDVYGFASPEHQQPAPTVVGVEQVVDHSAP